MANQLLTRQEITWESLDILENELHVLPAFYRDLDQEFGKKGGKIGDTIFVRKPPRAIGRDGQAYSPEGMTDTQVPAVINQQSGVDFEFSSAEKFLSIDDFSQRYLRPYMIALSNKLDFRCANVAMTNIANTVGTPGSVPGLNSTDAFLIYRQAGQKLEEMGFPLKEGRSMIITPAMTTGGSISRRDSITLRAPCPNSGKKARWLRPSWATSGTSTRTSTPKPSGCWAALPP